MRNINLGVDRREYILFGGSTLLVLVMTILWAVLFVPVFNDQAFNKYMLTVVLYGLSVLIAVVSLGATMRGASRRAMLPGFLVRFGLALQFFGIIIMPVGLFYATDPTRSVPVGFAAFSTAMIGLIIAGIGGNMLVPRRA
jgi:hypothetical protein